MSAPSLAGRVVALIGEGSDDDRALAIACAEAGADLALATKTPGQAAEFAMNSIANEAWVVGSEQFVRVMDASREGAVEAFAEETWARYGQCDAVILPGHGTGAAAAAGVFARRFGAAGHGVVVLAGAGPALEATGDKLRAEFAGAGVRVALLTGPPAEVVALIEAVL